MKPVCHWRALLKHFCAIRFRDAVISRVVAFTSFILAGGILLIILITSIALLPFDYGYNPTFFSIIFLSVKMVYNYRLDNAVSSLLKKESILSRNNK